MTVALDVVKYDEMYYCLQRTLLLLVSRSSLCSSEDCLRMHAIIYNLMQQNGQDVVFSTETFVRMKPLFVFVTLHWT